MLNAQDVQDYLRKYEPLKQVEVKQQSNAVLVPWLVTVCGSITIYGEHHVFESDLDLRQFGGRDDLENLAKQIMKSFAGAATHLKVA